MSMGATDQANSQKSFAKLSVWGQADNSRANKRSGVDHRNATTAKRAKRAETVMDICGRRDGQAGAVMNIYKLLQKLEGQSGDK